MAETSLNVITISRELGSQGTTLAQEVSRQLGYRLVWRDLINQAAQRAGAPEMALAAIDDLGLLGICGTPEECQAYRSAMGEIMNELAAEGNVVIVGRAGQVILNQRPNVLHVRVMAPIALRAARLAQQQHISLEGAKAQVDASDRFRRSFLRRFYDARWDNPELYDLILNTARVTSAQGAGLVIAALAHPFLDPVQELF